MDVHSSSALNLSSQRTQMSALALLCLFALAYACLQFSILVIDPGPTRHSAARMAETIAALEPQSVLVVADATSDLRVSLLALDALDQAGVAVESMALAKLDRAVKPAAALEIPVPVSWLDGRLATSGTWLGALVDALAETDDDSRIRPC